MLPLTYLPQILWRDGQPRRHCSGLGINKANRECEAKPAELQVLYLLKQYFVMESFHVNRRTDLEMFRFCLIYLLWSQYFLGKMQMLFQVIFSAEGSRRREESYSCSLLYPFPTAPMPQTAAISPVLQPHGRWIHKAELPQLLLSRTAEQESTGCLPPARPTIRTCQGGSKLSNDRLCTKLHRKHLGKSDRHHLTKGWDEQQIGVTHGSAKQGGN